MDSAAQKLTEDVMALPEKERLDVFVRLSTVMSAENGQIAESARRASEMHSGEVTPLSEGDFNSKMTDLRRAMETTNPTNLHESFSHRTDPGGETGATWRMRDL